MSPIRSIFTPISVDAADFDYGESAEWFGWKCLFCEDYAQDGVHLEMQFFGTENCLYHDSDGTLWVRCGNCLKCCHLHCLNPNLHPDNFKQALFQHDLPEIIYLFRFN